MRMTLNRAIWLVPALLLAACGGSEESSTTGIDAADEGGLPPLVPIVTSDAVRVDAPATMSRAELARQTVRGSIQGLHPTADFVVLREVDEDGQHHVRMNQTLDGVRVYGADVVVHLQDKNVVGLGGNVLAEVDTEEFSSKPAFDQRRALELAKKDRLGIAKIESSREEATLIVWLDGNKMPHLAYHTTFFTEHSDLMKPGLWNHIIDANTGKVIRSWNALHTLSQASGASGNAKFSHAWVAELDVESSGTSFIAQTSRLKTLNLKNATSGGTVFNGTLASFGDAAGNDAHGYAEVTLNMLRDWQGKNSIDNAGFVILSRVHYSRNYENAFWDGTQMTYGDGASFFYPLSGAIDVVAHEINHGFTEKHSGLVYTGQAGGMNESFSDVAGVTASFYYNASDASFDLGENIFKTAGALRYMCDPTADGSSIDNASKMTASLDPHYSSGVGNKAFCRAAKRFSSGSPTGAPTADGVKRASQAWFKANGSYWTSTTSFVQACQGIYDAAGALGYTATELGYLRDAWADVGVTCGGGNKPPPTGTFPECDETITSNSGTITSPNYPAVYGNNYAKTWCVIPASGSTVTLKFDSFATETNYDYVYVYGADGAQVSKTSGTAAPASITANKIAVKFTTDYSVTKKGFTASFSR